MSASGKSIHLYFHSPCFDGAVSAAIASDYLEQVKGYAPVQLHSVNYHLRDSWLASKLSQPCAIVDFLYHPLAKFWADHHPTTFLTPEAQHDFARRRGAGVFYDNSMPSCAALLWEHWGEALSHRGSHYKELVRWADRIDSARYERVEEAIALKAPALQINLALAIYLGDAFSHHLVWLFRTHSLGEIAARPEVQTAFAFGRNLQQLGQNRLERAIRLTQNGIAVFNVDGEGVLVNRYAPFHFFPQARYSAGVIRTSGQAKLTAMRNPWLEFPSAPLGQLCISLGGGGHERVGSVMVRDRDPADLLQTLLAGISTWEARREEAAAAAA